MIKEYLFQQIKLMKQRIMAYENENYSPELVNSGLIQTTQDLGNKIDKLSDVVEKLGELIKQDLLRTGSSSIPLQKSKTLKQINGVKQKITHFITDTRQKEKEDQEDLERIYPEAHKCEECQKHYCSLQRLNTHKKYKHKGAKKVQEDRQKAETNTKQLFLNKKEPIV
ncbi:hypothetical protein pb186bvf_012898 [Paramecium bursaria]